MEAGRGPGPHPSHATDTRTHRLNRFLTQRLKEELGQLWSRHRDSSTTDRRPGLASQLEVLDDLLTRLATGALPEPNDLHVLLACYRKHAEYEPGWTRFG